MESCSNQKSVKQIKIYFIFEILQSSVRIFEDKYTMQRTKGQEGINDQWK